MSTEMVAIPLNDALYVMDIFYNARPEAWHTPAKDALWRQALDVADDCDCLSGGIASFVDNYLINGDFVEKADGYTDEEWDELDALLKDDKYACIQF